MNYVSNWKRILNLENHNNRIYKKKLKKFSKNQNKKFILCLKNNLTSSSWSRFFWPPPRYSKDETPENVSTLFDSSSSFVSAIRFFFEPRCCCCCCLPFGFLLNFLAFLRPIFKRKNKTLESEEKYFWRAFSKHKFLFFGLKLFFCFSNFDLNFYICE